MRDLVKISCVLALSVFAWVGCGTTPSTSAIPCETAADCDDGLCIDGQCAALAPLTAGVFFPHPAGEEWWPAVGATVSVYGTSISATTDEDGSAELDAPVGTVFLHASAEGAWGSVLRVEVSPDGTTYVDFELPEDDYLRPMEEALGIKLDETKGIVEAWYPHMSSGGETLKLSEPYGAALTVDADGSFVWSSELQPGVSEPWLMFIGLNPTDELTVEPVGSEGEECRVYDCGYDCAPFETAAVYPVVAKSFTRFGVECGD